MIKKIKYQIKSIFLLLSCFGFSYKCPICTSTFRKFLSAGLYDKRKNAKCPKCKSLERHRILFLYILEQLDGINKNIKVLHIAPSNSLKFAFRLFPSIRYYTSDFPTQKDADYNFDIQNIESNDNEYDIVILNHVLEHIPDDRKAINEIYRILKPNGFSLIMVPLQEDSSKTTFEDPTITLPDDRIKYFGQDDHLRIYGLDIVDRLNDSGFNVEIINYLNSVSSDDKTKYLLINSSGVAEPIFHCKKLV